jgi:adenosine 3'-phospho 5'-phosphosulfate transporter B3
MTLDYLAQYLKLVGNQSCLNSRQPELKSHGWYLTLVQFLLYTIFSRLEMFHSRETRKIPFKTYLILALGFATKMMLSLVAFLVYCKHVTKLS